MKQVKHNYLSIVVWGLGLTALVIVAGYSVVQATSSYISSLALYSWGGAIINESGAAVGLEVAQGDVWIGSQASTPVIVDVNGRIQGSAVIQTSAGSGDQGKVPILDSGGKLDQSLLPFNKGDLIAPSDRSSISGLSGYNSDYFSIDELGVSGIIASNVCTGFGFGPGRSISGSAVCSGGGGGNDADSDGYQTCNIPQGNDCNDYNGQVKRDSTSWGFISASASDGSPDPANPVDRDNWLMCNLSWGLTPAGDYNCDLTVDKAWDGGIGNRYPVLYQKICDVGSNCCNRLTIGQCVDNQAGIDCADWGFGNDIGRCFTTFDCAGIPEASKTYKVVCQ